MAVNETVLSRLSVLQPDRPAGRFRQICSDILRVVRRNVQDASRFFRRSTSRAERSLHFGAIKGDTFSLDVSWAYKNDGTTSWLSYYVTMHSTILSDNPMIGERFLKARAVQCCVWSLFPASVKPAIDQITI